MEAVRTFLLITRMYRNALDWLLCIVLVIALYAGMGLGWLSCFVIVLVTALRVFSIWQGEDRVLALMEERNML